MNRFDNVIFGQKAFILNSKKRLLILKRKNSEVYNDFWDVPGGKLEEGDTLNEAITREVFEETGLKLKTVLAILTTHVFKGKAKDSPFVFRNIYLGSADGEVKLSSEHSEFKWIRASKLGQYKFPDDIDWQKALEKLPAIIKKIDVHKPISEVM